MRRRTTPVYALFFCIATGCGPGDARAPDKNAQFQQPGDTSTPPIPSSLNLPERDTLIVPSPVNAQVLYYRNIVLVAFDDTTCGSSIRSLLDRYGAEIIGGADYVGPRGAYVLRIPDPGPTLAALDSIVSQMEKESGVAEATSITYRDVAKQLRGERPR